MSKAGIRLRKKKRNQLMLIVLTCIVLVLLVMSSPIFTIDEIKIEGNSAVSQQKIIEALETDEGKNIFHFSTFKASRSLLKNPFIQQVSIKRELPRKVSVEILERKVRSYVLFETTESYLLIDEYGRVLDVMSYMPERLPVIVGLKVTGFTVGELMEAENADNFEHVVILSQLLTKYGIEDVVKVDVSSGESIDLNIGNVIVKFGSIDDADEKVRTLREVILKFDFSLKGTLDMTDIKKEPIFKYLT